MIVIINFVIIILRRLVDGHKSWLAHTEIESDLDIDDVNGDVNDALGLDLQATTSYINGTATSTLEIYGVPIEQGTIEYYCHIAYAPKVSEIAETVDSSTVSILVMCK